MTRYTISPGTHCWVTLPEKWGRRLVEVIRIHQRGERADEAKVLPARWTESQERPRPSYIPVADLDDDVAWNGERPLSWLTSPEPEPEPEPEYKPCTVNLLYETKRGKVLTARQCLNLCHMAQGRGDEHDCWHGHFGCSFTDRGPCENELDAAVHHPPTEEKS
jgi:hypothetical protein